MAERILCVLGKLRAGGVESMMYSYYRVLDKSRWQYDFVYEEGSEFDAVSYTHLIMSAGDVMDIKQQDNMLILSAKMAAQKDVYKRQL